LESQGKREHTQVKNRGFTLIEVMTCLLLMSALATVATVRLWDGHRTSGLDAAVAELESNDRRLRDHSRRTGHRGEMVFDLTSGRASYGEADAVGDVQQIPFKCLDEETHIAELHLIGGDSSSNDKFSRVVYTAGRTPSFKVLLTSRDDQHRWLVVCGLTGQCQEVTDEEADEMFGNLRRRND
jgi:prepilin-type N-terminal cleavage/methylation domain-containing protein